MLIDDDPSFLELYRVGVMSELIDVTQLREQRWTGRIIVKGLERVRLVRMVAGQNCVVEVELIEEASRAAVDAHAIREAVLSKIRNLPDFDLSSSFCSGIGDIQEPGLLADMVAPFLQMSVERAQGVLEEHDPVSRLKKILDVMSDPSVA